MELTKQMKMAAAGAAAVIVVGGGVFAFTQMSEGDPKETVIKAFENIYTEGQTDPLEELFGLSEFAKTEASSSSEGGLTLKLDSCSEPAVSAYAGSGLRIEGKEDTDSHKSSFNMGVIYNGMDLANLNLYYGDHTLMAAVPELSSRVFTLDLGEGLGDRVKNSPVVAPALEQNGIDPAALAEYLNTLLAQAQQEDEGQTESLDLKGLMNRYREGCKAEDDFKAAMTVKKGEKGTFTVDGKEVSCKGYEVSISKDAMISFLRTSSDFFLQDETLKNEFLNQMEMSVQFGQLMGGNGTGQEFPTAKEMQEQTYEEAKANIDEMISFLESSLNDVQMTVHVDSKGRLVSVKGTTSLNDPDKTETESEPVSVNFSCELKGGSYLTQNLNAQVEMVNGDETLVLTAAKDGTYDGKQLTGGLDLEMKSTGAMSEEWKAAFDGSYNSDGGAYDLQAAVSQDGLELVSLSAKGAVDQLEKGKSIHVAIDSITASAMGDTGNVVLSGEYHFGPLSGEVVPLEGETMDILAATEEEWNAVAMEILFGAIGIGGEAGLIQ